MRCRSSSSAPIATTSSSLEARQARLLTELSGTAEHVHLTGLEQAEVEELVGQVAGRSIADRWAAEVARRSGGHPLFAKELSQLLARHPAPDAWVAVPAAIRDVIERRLARLSPGCVRMLRAAAVCGNDLVVDVVAEVCGDEPGNAVDLAAEGIGAGILVADDPLGARARFAHDLFRDVLYEGLPARDRLSLHLQVGGALEQRHDTSNRAHPSEIARHFAAAIALDGPDRALRWALAAAAADRASLAFAESAGHLGRVRVAAETNGVTFDPGTLVDVLVIEADARLRAGDPSTARVLLLERAHRLARDRADPDRLAAVALGVQRLGARTGMPRHEVVNLLEEACTALAGSGSAAEARVTATLAREVADSVRADHDQARRLSEGALELARRVADPETLALCLLARHDVVWGPGTAAERLELAGEIVALAEIAGDRERRCDGVLLRASALLELGSPTFRSELDGYVQLAGALREPRHDYLVLTRRAALALLDGRVDDAEILAEEAAALGRRISEPDVDNVLMSQTLAARWARGDRDELLEFADRAVAWLVEIPTFAHAVAAACRARAGDIDGARLALAVVTELDEWHLVRSPLPSVIPLVTVAAARLGEREMCATLYDELTSVSTECAVFGAAVCFMGSYAHWAGVAALALDEVDRARSHLESARAVHERLGARTWRDATDAELVVLGGPVQAPPRRAAEEAVFRPAGAVWQLHFAGSSASIPDARGLRDIALLLSRAGRAVPAVELLGLTPGAPRASGVRGPATFDERARREIRNHLRELDAEVDRAEAADDGERAALARERRQALAEAVARDLGLGGRSRRLDDAVERARKTVSTRIHRAIRRVEQTHPELGRHLGRSITTGTLCVYDPAEPVRWTT